MIKLRESWRNIYPGAVLGRLTVLGWQFRISVSSRPRWLCVAQCKCGKTIVCEIHNLSTGHSASCGCYVNDVNAHRLLRHGESIRATSGKATSLYVCWLNMKARCFNCKSRAWKNYGGRGITVCDEWRWSYEAFREWAITNGYKPELTIDRIANDGNYEPNNCRWATRKEQARNKRTSRFIYAFGESKTLCEWSADARCKVNYHLFRLRIRRGWNAENAMTITSSKTTAGSP